MRLARNAGMLILGASVTGSYLIVFNETAAWRSTGPSIDPGSTAGPHRPAIPGSGVPNRSRLGDPEFPAFSAALFEQTPSMLDVAGGLAPLLRTASAKECLHILHLLAATSQSPAADPSVVVALRMVMDRLCTLSPTEAITAAGLLAPSLRSEALPEVMRIWSASSPLEAAAWMEARNGSAFKSGSDDARLTAELIRQWSKSSPSAALEWLSGQSEDRQMAGWPSVVAGHRASDLGDLALATQYLLPGPVRTSACGALARQWARTDPVAACGWAASLSGLEALAVLGVAYEGWAGTNPADSAEAALKLPAGFQRDVVLPAVARRWAADDPLAACEWSAALPEGKGRAEALGQAVWAYLQQKPEAAAPWMQAYFPPGTNDAVSRLGAQHLLVSDPPQAASGAASISDPEVRRETVNGVLGWWHQVNPAAALAW